MTLAFERGDRVRRERESPADAAWLVRAGARRVHYEPIGDAALLELEARRAVTRPLQEMT